ncbi:hypothetical protein DOE76_06015 [Leifsonia sp. ku-ls]|nr:hypothetical protein DOE76_06015 [Leifsonia sp. ku-ls]
MAGTFALVSMLVLFVAVALFGVLRPAGLSLAWFTGNADWWMFLVSVLTLLATATIPVALFLFSRASERRAHDLMQQQASTLAALTTVQIAIRMDILVEQAATMTQREDRQAVLEEARKLDSGRQKTRVFEAYWRNPATPLCGDYGELDQLGASVVAGSLKTKLRDVDTFEAMRRLQRFVKTVKEIEAKSISSQVADWVVERSEEGNGPGDTSVRRLLEAARDDDLYGALLYGVNRRSFHTATEREKSARVNVTAGVCGAFLERIAYFSEADDMSAPATRERDARLVGLSSSMLQALATGLTNGCYRGMSHWDTEGMSITAGGAAAYVVAACGAGSFGDRHLAMRCLQNIPGMFHSKEGFRNTLLRYEEELNFGGLKFEDYHPDLVAQLWPSWRDLIGDWVTRSASRRERS